MLPKFIDAPDTPTVNVIIFTLDILYIHHSMAVAFGIWMAETAAKEKNGPETQHKFRDPQARPKYVNSMNI